MSVPRNLPISGEGARIHGGRFNPPHSFAVVYLCTTRSCAVAEFRRAGQRRTIGITGLLPRALYRYGVSLESVLDLSERRSRDHLEVTLQQVLGTDLDLPRRIGEAAYGSGFQAIAAPSATGVDHVVAVFPDRVGVGDLVPRLKEIWALPSDL